MSVFLLSFKDLPLNLVRFVLLLSFFILGNQAKAQVSTYTFTNTTATYNSISGTAIFSDIAWDDNTPVAFTIPFIFWFNNVAYTSVSINPNGYVTFGGTASGGASYIPISATTGYAGAVSAFGRDLASGGTDVTYTITGSAPDRVFVVQWNSAKRYSGGALTDNLNFQIRLYEATNVVEVHFGAMSAASTSCTHQVGLRGSANTDYNNLTSTTTWVTPTQSTSGGNGVTMTSTNTILPASGRVYRWTPATVTNGVYFYGQSFGTTNWCTSETRSISVNVKNTGTATWVSNSGTNINFSYWWSTQSGQDANPRIFPFVSVAPGATATITFNATAPASAGSATINYDLVKDGACWFRSNTAGCGNRNNTMVSASQTILTSPSITSNPSSSSIATGANTTFTAVGNNSPSSYSWEVNTGSGWNSVSNGGVYSGATTGTLSITAAPFSMNGYQFRAYANNTCGTSTASSAATLTLTYCATSPTTVNTVDIITNVLLTNSLGASYANASASNGSTNYDIYNNTPLDLIIGSTTNSLAITVGNDGTQASAAWIDFNRNGIYEASENVALSSVLAGANAVVTYSGITVPSGAIAGNTRMRVRAGADVVANYTAGGACTASPYGETEDYLVNLLVPPPTFSNTSAVSCEKIAFNNLRDANVNPRFAFTGTAGTSDRVQIELNTKADFTGTAYTQTVSGTFSGNYNVTTTTLNLPTTNDVIYYARVRDSKNSGVSYSSWSTQTWAYTYSTATPGYHITTKPQFDGGTNVTTTYGNYLSTTGTGVASDYMNLGVGSFAPTSATTDAVYENGVYYPSVNYMTIGWQNNCNGNDAIFDGYPFTLNIPQGATINSANFSVVGSPSCVCEDQTVTLKLIADAHLANTAPTLTSSNLTNTVSPTRTTATQTISHTTTWSSGTRYTLSSVTNIVQEIVSRFGFVAGNSMNLLLRWNTGFTAGSNNNRCLYQADNGTSTAPQISGEFTNFSNSRKFTNIQLASFGSSCAKWDKLLTNETVSGCGSCSVNYKVFVAGTATLIAQGIGSVDLAGTAYNTTSAVDIEVIVKRDNGTPQINDFTLTTTTNANASLATVTKTPTTTCEDLSGGWTYYLDPLDATKQIIGIQWGNNNSTSKCNAALNLNVKTTGTTAYDVVANTTTKKAAFTMGRYWNVTTTPSTLNSAVSVRFFYNPTDTATMRTAANAWAAANPTSIPGYTTKAGILEWFKTIGINFRSDSMKANGTHGGSSGYFKPTPVYGSLNSVSYVQYDGVASFSGGTAGIQVYPVPNANNPVSLPVQLIYLTATPIENQFIRLEWATASEVNNKGFDVERSEDGENFTKIGWVDGNGNSSQKITYKLDDKDVIPNRVYYYRLKQVDNDGKEEYTYIVSAKLLSEKGFVFEDLRPNPASNKVVLRIFTSTIQEVKVNVFDVLGQEVLTQNWQLLEGLNGTELDLQNLSGGTYTVIVISEGTHTSKKLVIAR